MERFAFHPKESTRVTFAFMMVYLIAWGAQYIGCNFLPIYVNSLPFATNSTVGVVLAVGAITTIMVQSLWGQMADRAKTKNSVLKIALIVQGATALLFCVKMPNMPMLLLAVVIFYIAFLAPQTLVETIVVENSNKVKVRFGVLRCFSSGGCALAALILGMMKNPTGEVAFALFSVCAVASLIPLHFVPATKGHASGKKDKISFKKLLGNRRFMVFLAYGLALFFCGSIFNSFFSIYVSTEQGLNTGVAWYSRFMALTILMEALVMLFGAKKFAKMNPYAVFIIPLIAGVIRMATMVLAKDTGDMWIYPFSHAMWFGPLWAKVAPFIQSVVPEEMRATGQSMWMIATNGFAPVMGALIAGGIAETYSIHTLYILGCVLMAVLCVVFAILFILQNRRDKAEGWKMQY